MKEMSTPTFEQVTMKLKASGVPYNASTIQAMCGCSGGDAKHNMAHLSAQKMCGCGGHGDEKPSLPKRKGY